MADTRSALRKHQERTSYIQSYPKHHRSSFLLQTDKVLFNPSIVISTLRLSSVYIAKAASKKRSQILVWPPDLTPIHPIKHQCLPSGFLESPRPLSLDVHHVSLLRFPSATKLVPPLFLLRTQQQHPLSIIHAFSLLHFASNPKTCLSH